MMSRLLLLLIISASIAVGCVSALSPSHQHRSRRDFLKSASTTTAVAASFLLLDPPSAQATAVDSGEAIRRSAANLPGYGPTDVFFPKQYLGSWKMTRTTAASADSTDPTTTVSFPIRFIQSVDESAVVMDRGFNQKQYLEALQRILQQEGAAVQSCDWKVSNPNDLRWTTSGSGARNEIKVTKRATDYGDFVSSSEFQRITREDSRTGIPVIEARRVLTKYRVVSPDVLEGIELVYSMGAASGDPMAPVQSNSAGPQLLSKTRLRLERSVL